MNKQIETGDGAAAVGPPAGDGAAAVDSPAERIADVRRVTKETDICVRLNLDGTGNTSIETGIGFLNHLLDAFARHGRFDLVLKCTGDLGIDDHHTAEDCGLVIGQAISRALGDRKGIRRFGYAYAPLDEALARAVVDISGRAYADVNTDLERERLGELSCENVGHILQSIAATAGITVHVDVIKGRNDHHKAEAAFKAVGLALRHAVAMSAFEDVPSTKGKIERGIQ